MIYVIPQAHFQTIQKMQRDLLWQSAHDAATGLANRKHFFRAVRRSWLRSECADGFVVGVIQLGVSTPGGEAAGSEIRTPILREYAQLLPRLLPSNALLARAGESAIAFWSETSSRATAQALAEALLHAIASQPQEINGVRYSVGAHAGLMWTSDCLTPDAYYDNANAACARARESGSAVVHYNSESDANGVLPLAKW